MEQDKIDQYNEDQAEAAEQQRLLDAIDASGRMVAETVVAAEQHTKNVTITNDLAKPQDIARVVEAGSKLGGDLKPKDLQPVTDALSQVSQAIAKLPTKYPDFPSFPELPEPREDVKVTNLSELKGYFTEVVTAVSKLQTSIKFDPKIEVKPADVNVTEKSIDLSPITKGLTSLEKAFKSIKTPNFDTTDLAIGLAQVKESIQNLSFPASNFMLPYKDEEGVSTQLQLVQGSTTTIDAILAARLDDTASPIIYIGKAPVGSDESSAVWQIAKLDTSSGLSKTWAGTAGFDQVWANRSGLTYQ